MNDKYLIDGHKMLWHLDRLKQWQEGQRIAPLRIDLGITNGCNMNCIFCYGVVEGRTTADKRSDMPKGPLLRLLRDAKDIGVRSVNLVGEGENTLNSEMYDALLYARSIGLDMSLATNGLALKADRTADLLSCVAWIKFNLCAITDETFEVLHRIQGRSLRRIVENITHCVQTKRKMNLKTTLGIQMIVMQQNMNEIIPMAKTARKLGVDYLSIKPCSDTPARTMNVPVKKYVEIEDILKEAESYSTDHYQVIVKWNKMMNLGMKDYGVCYGTDFFIAISGTGGVYPCGHFIGNADFLMSNILGESLKDIVLSEKYQQIQNKVRTLDVNRDCETNCGHYYINEFLWQLKNPPQHINFV